MQYDYVKTNSTERKILAHRRKVEEFADWVMLIGPLCETEIVRQTGYCRHTVKRYVQDAHKMGIMTCEKIGRVIIWTTVQDI